MFFPSAEINLVRVKKVPKVPEHRINSLIAEAALDLGLRRCLSGLEIFNLPVAQKIVKVEITSLYSLHQSCGIFQVLHILPRMLDDEETPVIIFKEVIWHSVAREREISEVVHDHSILVFGLNLFFGTCDGIF